MKVVLLLKYTVYLSLFVQIVTGITDALALQLKVPPKITLLRQALILELIVQIIEGMFYLWLVFAIQRGASNVTPKRYYDWFLTTPTMLFTLMVYLHYLKNPNKKQTLRGFAKKYQHIILQVVLLNALMLVFGYLGETGRIQNQLSVLLGFVPFIMYYCIIYHEFVKNNPEGEMFFWYFVIVWSIYGVAALLPYHPKNMMYNILDLFAKNFFGLYLAYLLYTNRE
jgi:bacteriorhodopsin